MPKLEHKQLKLGDAVRLSDGRSGTVRRREFRYDRAEVQAYEILLTGGRGVLWLPASALAAEQPCEVAA